MSFAIVLPLIPGKPSYGCATSFALSFMTHSMMDNRLSASRWACCRVQGLLCEDTCYLTSVDRHMPSPSIQYAMQLAMLPISYFRTGPKVPS
ncbi:hypothetical protein ARMSODRAFT_962127 [Armillaria solidipes]|uniref:Uncharacterized protein n=1 Tax=Armillaria solidipes TaxID=1076256 RepID=A0A2H3BDZ8_9AGAR|nr:hypothetical protein ARMSODRAFT_962127 [Armillaria solidipes]